MFKGGKVDEKIHTSSTKKYRTQRSSALLDDSESIFDNAKKMISIDPLFQFVMYVDVL